MVARLIANFGMLEDSLYLENIQEYVQDENKIVRLEMLAWFEYNSLSQSGDVQMAQSYPFGASKCCKEVSLYIAKCHRNRRGSA